MERIVGVVEGGFADGASVASFVPIVDQEWKAKANELASSAQDEAANDLFEAGADVHDGLDLPSAGIAIYPHRRCVVSHFANATGFLARQMLLVRFV